VSSALAGRALRNRDAATLVLPRFRSPLVFGALALLFTILLGRSLYLQWFDNEFLQGQGSARHSRELEVPAHRGRIVDRAGEALALSTPVRSLWAFPDKFDATPEQIASLAAILETTPHRISARLDANEDFAFIAKQVAPEIADRAMALRIPGLHDQNEYRRFYPGGEVTAHIVGFTGDRDAGQEGIELAQQAWLAGIPGSRRVIINRRNEAVEDVAAIRAPQAGHDLALSIDARLQYLAFRELKARHRAQQGQGGRPRHPRCEDRRNPGAGELADVQPQQPQQGGAGDDAQPRADRHVRARIDDEAVHDRGGARGGPRAPETVIETSPGTLTIGSATIHDAHAEGALTVEQVIQKSSNVGAAKIALGLPSATLWEMFSNAGFGTPPKTGFPGEQSGRLRPAKSWRPIEQATMSYGHGISVNLVQLARAYTMFATDGEVKAATLFKTETFVAGRPVLQPETARAVRHMLELVTSPGGTAPRAQVPGYRVAGKTGTAHKVEGHGYGNKYVASFVGFAPVSNPRLVVAVMIDEPSAGSTTAARSPAPVFSNVTGSALRMLGVPTDAPLNNVILPPQGSEIREET
jgi:cell division protein FtsI (penicillin-binding protein 3)